MVKYNLKEELLWGALRKCWRELTTRRCFQEGLFLVTGGATRGNEEPYILSILDTNARVFRDLEQIVTAALAELDTMFHKNHPKISLYLVCACKIHAATVTRGK